MSPYLLKRTLTLTMILILGLASCRKDNNPPAVSKPLDLPANSENIVDAGNHFAFSFFASVAQQDPAETNLLISPLSIYTALSMLYNGAAGATRDSISTALALNGIPIDALNALNKALIEQMPSEDNKVAVSIANSIWINKNIGQPRQSFLDTIRNNYKALIQPLDFSSAASVNTINSWVAKNTNNKIPSILQSIDANEFMYLINTVYFNGSWLYAFKPGETYSDYFHLHDGSTVKVPFMKQQVMIRTSHGPSFTLAELPYGSGKGFDMYLVIPDSPDPSIAGFAAAFNNAALTDAVSKLDSHYTELLLPKWEYSYKIGDMKPHLSRLGMGIAFGNADFSNMYAGAPPGQIRITKALHNTYIKVSEEGTEAAAVTTIGIGLTAINTKFIKADHPFLYLIREKQTGVILFIGIVNNPLDKG